MMMPVAYASDNGVEIDMSGTVIASTCDVETADTLQTIFIGNFASTLFTTVGDVSPTADLLIRLNNCSSGISGATVTFSGTPDNDNNKLLALSDTSESGGMATGVGVEILDANKNSVAINADSESQPLKEGDNNTLTFFLRYKATKIPVTAGNASSVMYFDLSYQ
ncbi:type 1 fimbrial protein [Kluyvera georgiana ATCC 51603]|uniref:Type 1 fimbrial protein n=2 Tax=Kluyvera georgiana TaxID=73098 RepID=A0A1B7JZX6_9ENTR|nr:type 1 fimbrial protein [Kluyvera georgiana ATCC 51603]